MTLPIRWQESETLAVQGSQCTEVTLVKGEEPPSSVRSRLSDAAYPLAGE